MPGERIAGTIVTADSSTFTAETVVISVVAPLVSGRTYRVRSIPGWMSTVSDDAVQGRLREDSVSGTQLDATEVRIGRVSSTAKYVTPVEARYTATSTGNKTFVVSGARIAGTGDVNLVGASNRRNHLDVCYESG
jgi:hypothetical protein